MENIIMEALKKNKEYLIGIGLVLLTLLPYLILGSNSHIMIHDNLESYTPHQMTYVKNLFESGLVEELLNGINKFNLGGLMIFNTSILFYLFLSPFKVYIIQMLIIKVIAFIGMYSFSKRLQLDGKYVVFRMAISLGFTLIGSYYQFGLSILGIPLLIVCLMNLYESKYVKSSIIYLIFFGLNSTLIFTFPFVGLLIFQILYHIITKKKLEKLYLISIAILIVSSLIGNYALFFNAASMKGIPTQRDLWPVVSAGNFKLLMQNIVNIVFKGQEHALFGGIVVSGISVLFFIVVLFIKPADKNEKKMYDIIFKCILVFIAIIVFLLIWKSSLLNNLKEQVSFFNKFQFDRVYMLLPPLYFMGFLTSILFLLKNKKTLIAFIFSAGLVVVVLSAVVIENKEYTVNLGRLVKGSDYKKTENPSWKDFYDVALFEKIDKDIGIEKKDYRVVSLGISPSITQYNGYYQLDSYLSEYPLTYHKEFGKIIEDELSKSEELYAYFNKWGNRCYLFSSELGPETLITKEENITVSELSIDTRQLNRMGGKYIISTVKIGNTEQLGLIEKNEYESEGGIWHIYLYEVL